MGSTSASNNARAASPSASRAPTPESTNFEMPSAASSRKRSTQCSGEPTIAKRSMKSAVTKAACGESDRVCARMS